MYADDVTSEGTDPVAVQPAMDVVKDWSTVWNLPVNDDKYVKARWIGEDIFLMYKLLKSGKVDDFFVRNSVDNLRDHSRKLFKPRARALRIFERCLARPMFIFDECHITAKLSTQLSRSRDRLQSSRTVAHLDLKRLDTNHTSLHVPILLSLTPLVWEQSMTAMYIPFVVSDRQCYKDAVGLVMHLHCPVIEVPGTCLLPLRFPNWTP
ncbi:unnamed protein product [Echinostoma caproni]|uniref:SNF2_N domain-containing protein n=1 Tax=Echinostoma caproni TaxID=27848 RepID=A0A183AV70_9TREM|nr:unnamed protein product [Echinostoma caproni]